MLRICDLSFVENSILTKEMLEQMYQEPKWLFLVDHFRDIENGIISGFEFINHAKNDYSILTKGNLFIEGKWYRMDTDVIFHSDDFESGEFYFVGLRKRDEGVYEVITLKEKDFRENDIKIAKFKYENASSKRVFRVPDKLEDYEKKDAFVHDIEIPYYNSYGVAIFPPHIAQCIKNSLLEKGDRSVKEEIIFQKLLNEKNISIASILDLLGIMEEEVLVSDSMINELNRKIAMKSVDVSMDQMRDKEYEPQGGIQPKRGRAF